MQALNCQPKLWIKIPKLLLKTMPRKFHFHRIEDKGNRSESEIERGKRGNQFRRKLIGLVFSGVLGNTRSIEKKTFKGNKNEPDDDSEDGKAPFGNNLVFGDEPVVAALSQLLRHEETNLEPYEGKQNRKDKHPVKMNLYSLCFIYRKKGRNFTKVKARTGRSSTNMHGDGSIRKANKDGNVVVNSFRLVRRKASSCRLVRIPSKILVIRLKLKIRSLMKKKVTTQFEQDLEQEGDENGDEEEVELWKKRILMGGRCKPLSSSGILS